MCDLTSQKHSRIVMMPASASVSVGICESHPSLPFSVGGLAPPAASRSREGAHWASWSDCLPIVHERHPMVQGMARDPSPCFEAVTTCVAHLTEAGFEVPVDSVEGQHHCCPSRFPRTQRAQVWVAAQSHTVCVSAVPRHRLLSEL